MESFRIDGILPQLCWDHIGMDSWDSYSRSFRGFAATGLAGTRRVVRT